MTSRRRVSAIVCAYARDELPTWWVQVHRRFERAIEKAGLRVRVRLMPLEDLPDGFDVLVVAPELGERADALGRGAMVIRATRANAGTLAGDLVRELEAGTSLYAERANPDDPKIVVHRGPEIL